MAVERISRCPSILHTSSIPLVVNQCIANENDFHIILSFVSYLNARVTTYDNARIDRICKSYDDPCPSPPHERHFVAVAAPIVFLLCDNRPGHGVAYGVKK